MREMKKAQTFHSGEMEVQTRLGVHERVMSYAPRMIRSYMPDQHRDFFAQLPMIYVGWLDAGKRPWASVVFGEPGFINSPNPKTLHINARPPLGDPLENHLTPGTPLGFLGLEPHSRRRNRLAGKVVNWGNGFQIEVDQSFGNCPQYILPRLFEKRPNFKQTQKIQKITQLEGRVAELIEQAETFFIASYFHNDPQNPSHGADISHRGGKPGFVKLEDPKTLIFPDFNGNNHFNTLGNIHKNPVAGLLFMDYESGDLLQLTGSAEILWEHEWIQDFPGAKRFVRLKLDEGLLLQNAMPLQWRNVGEALTVPQTGTWIDAAKNRKNRLANSWRKLKVTRVVQESETIRSFYLQPLDNKPLTPFAAGQFLPIRVSSPDGETLYRAYSLSGNPGEPYYRLSIKREDGGQDKPPGQVSNLFHKTIQPGSIIQAMKPTGDFVPDITSHRPLVLLSAGVGVTPMISMMETLCQKQPYRKLWFLHGARNGRTHAFKELMKSSELVCPSWTIHIRYSQPDKTDQKGKDYHDKGRIDISLLKSLLPFDDYEFYICGPEGFMRDIYQGLRAMNIAKERIHHEFFGKGDLAAVDEQEKTRPVKVRFKTTGTEALWKPGDGTLLDLAEKNGLSPNAGCRAGACLTCATKIISGNVAHRGAAGDAAPQGCALLCSATPLLAEGEALVLDL